MKKFFLLIIASFAIILTGCGGGGGDTSLKSLITGHKYYYVDSVNMSDGSEKYFVREVTFGADGVVKAKDSEVDNINYTIKNNTIIFTKKGEEGSKELIFIKKTDKGLVFKGSENGSENGEKFTLYFTKDLAQEVAKEEESSQCRVNEDTVLVGEGKTCHYDDHTATCQEGKVTVDNTLQGNTVTLDGYTYTCN